MRVLVLCVRMHKAHAQGDCCEAMHACVGVYFRACKRHMHTLNAARRCIRVSECVFVLCARRCFDVCMFVHE